MNASFAHFRSVTCLAAMAAVGLSACASIPPPDILAQLDQARQAPVSATTKKLAPAAFLQAEKLRQQANRHFEQGDGTAAQLVGERALAAYIGASAQARRIQAEESRVVSEADLAQAQERMRSLDVSHQQVAADMAALEKRLLVLRNLEPTAASKKTSPARERARAEAVAALRVQARLLCSAAVLLSRGVEGGPQRSLPEAVTRALAASKKLDQALAAQEKPAPIDQAMRVRAACLEGLSAVRRAYAKSAGDSAGTDSFGSDALLAALAETGHGAPRRDDRGVVLTLRRLDGGKGLTEQARKMLREISSVAMKYPAFPVMVVVHTSKPSPERASARRAGEVVRALRAELPGARVGDAEFAGSAFPLVDPKGRYASRNARFEIVFVAPTAH